MIEKDKRHTSIYLMRDRILSKASDDLLSLKETRKLYIDVYFLATKQLFPFMGDLEVQVIWSIFKGIKMECSLKDRDRESL